MLNNKRFLTIELKKPKLSTLNQYHKAKLIDIIYYHFDCRVKIRNQLLKVNVENDFLKRQHELDNIKLQSFPRRSFAFLKTRKEKDHTKVETESTNAPKC